MLRNISSWWWPFKCGHFCPHPSSPGPHPSQDKPGASQARPAHFFSFSSGQFQLPTFKFQVSSFKFQVTSCKLKASSFKFQVSICKLQALSCKFQIPNHKFQSSNFKCPSSSFNCQAPRFKLQVSSFNAQGSSSKFQNSNFKFQMSSFKLLAPRLQCLPHGPHLESLVCHFGTSWKKSDFSKSLFFKIWKSCRKAKPVHKNGGVGVRVRRGSLVDLLHFGVLLGLQISRFPLQFSFVCCVLTHPPYICLGFCARELAFHFGNDTPFGNGTPFGNAMSVWNDIPLWRSIRGRLGGIAMARVREGCNDSKRDDMKGNS